MVEIAKREWPQRWSDLTDNLFQIAGLGDAQLEIVLLIFTSLTEDIERFNEELDNKRKVDLHAALIAVTDQLFPFLISQLEGRVSHIKEISGDAPEAQIHYGICDTILKLFAVFLDWIPFKSSFVRLAGFFSYLLRVPRLRLSACECILVIAERKPKFEDREVVLTVFGEVVNMKMALDACGATEAKFIDEDTHNFVKSLCKALSLLGANQLPFLYSKLNSLPGSFDTYMMLMLFFLNHKSVLVSSFTISLWCAILRPEDVRNSEPLHRFYKHILLGCLQKAAKFGDPDSGLDEGTVFSKHDFDDSADFGEFFTSMRNRLFEVFSLLMLVCPGDCIVVASDRLKDALVSPYIRRNQSRSAYLNLQSAPAIQLEAAAFGVESIVNILVKRFKKDSNFLIAYKGTGLHISLMSCVNFLAHFESQDPTLMLFAVNVMSALPPYFEYVECDISDFIDKITALITFIPDRERASFMEDGNISDETLVLRRKGQAVFNRLCSSIPARLQNDLPKMTQFVLGPSQQERAWLRRYARCF